MLEAMARIAPSQPKKTDGARKKVCLFCLVTFKKTPNKTPTNNARRRRHSPRGGVQKKNVFIFCLLPFEYNSFFFVKKLHRIGNSRLLKPRR